MTIGAWLREGAAAPPQLSARIADVLTDRLDEPFECAADVLLECAARQLAELVALPAAGRESALDLLTVDALVTYALEAASANPSSLSSHATAAMRRLGGLAAS